MHAINHRIATRREVADLSEEDLIEQEFQFTLARLMCSIYLDLFSEKPGKFSYWEDEEARYIRYELSDSIGEVSSTLTFIGGGKLWVAIWIEVAILSVLINEYGHVTPRHSELEERFATTLVPFMEVASSIRREDANERSIDVRHACGCWTSKLIPGLDADFDERLGFVLDEHSYGGRPHIPLTLGSDGWWDKYRNAREVTLEHLLTLWEGLESVFWDGATQDKITLN